MNPVDSMACEAYDPLELRTISGAPSDLKGLSQDMALYYYIKQCLARGADWGSLAMAQFAEVNVVMAVDRNGARQVFKIDNSII
jgi:hypothetical protein